MKKTALIIMAAALSFSCLAKDYEYAVRKQDMTCKDTTKVLCIGNSFTYVFDTYNILTEIAWSQGHCIQATAAYVGGYSFEGHLADIHTIWKIETSTPYDVVFLQNKSWLNGKYGENPKLHRPALRDAVEITERVREFSPEARVFLENTWSYYAYNCGGFGSLDKFDSCNVKGTAKLAKKCRCTMSPIGQAFTLSRKQNPQTDLLLYDKHHQSMEGAYLKACVNYLMIFGGCFSDSTSCCGLDRESARALQKAAEAVVSRK